MVLQLPFDATAAADDGAAMAGLAEPKPRTFERSIAGHVLLLIFITVTSDASGAIDMAALLIKYPVHMISGTTSELF
ncbi:hypothetical protein [uncultured Jannaschia sp.]|uniref:hypothetical protein n=1 Tax=uncultured Jannaschia sp. TaxID=293347 RepID=UPI00260D1A27|nr:hypothetical protein [uncultured Jannaschia sp.]